MSRSVGPESRNRRPRPERPSEPPPPNDGLALRLAIGRDGLGIELASKATSDCLDVVELVIRLPNVRFPFDVSGGVARFRHKRGELERLAVELDARRVGRWMSPRLAGLLGTGAPHVLVEPRRFGATITVHPARAPADALMHTRVPALAFDLALLASGEDLVIVVHDARGAHLTEPPTTLAIRAIAAVLGAGAHREGARFVLARCAAHLSRALLPESGVRVPSADGVELSACGESDGVLFLAFTRDGATLDAPREATLASELALLAKAGDDARIAGNLDDARARDLSALERAPRHPELLRRIAEVDAVVGGRAEAAVATLGESATRGNHGLLLGTLLVEIGDTASAIAALLRQGEREPSDTLGALAFARAAELTSNADDALRWLDSAVGRAPRLAELRWERARRRMNAGRFADARADFQELEAFARGARERHEVFRRAAETYRSLGLGQEAAKLYERALLYKPEDPSSLAGLGAALASCDRAARGAAVLAHAIELAAKRRTPTSWMELELGRILGEHLGDRPAAIARLRSIDDEAPEAIEARGLEGRFRRDIGDVAGASLAFARLRERAGRESSGVAWLLEAATFEAERGAVEAAQRHAGAALAIAPDNVEVASFYRALGERLAQGATTREQLPAPRPVSVEKPVKLPEKPAPARAPASYSEAEAEERVEVLRRKLEGDPTDDAVIDELIDLLRHLGRSMELLAVLSARLEDAPSERRAELLPRHREVLTALEAEAREAGREAEADLFKMAREAT